MPWSPGCQTSIYFTHQALQSAYTHTNTTARSHINAIDNQATHPKPITSTITNINMRSPSFNNNNLNLNFRGGESRDGGAPNRSAKFNLPMMKAMRGGPESRDGG
jgi:hypothetical protein